MEVMKITILFVSLACLTFGKFIESKTRDTSDRFKETLERDATLSQSERRRNDYFSRFLAAPAADGPNLRNMCEERSISMNTGDFFGWEEKEFLPTKIDETFCASDSDGEQMRCGGSNFCVTVTERMQFNYRTKGSSGRYRKTYKSVRVACSCWAPH